MSTPPPLWHDWHNAEIYHRFVRERPLYVTLNRRLAELAHLEDSQRVLDLACGSGATAEACLPDMPARAELLGVDFSAAMVGVAKAQVQDPRARFRVVSPSELEKELRGPFDRVLSNAAFWQLENPKGVLTSLAKLMPANGLLVFNVPAEELRDVESAVHPFQVALASALDRVGGERVHPDRPVFDAGRLRGWLEAADFHHVEALPFVYQGRQGELMELMEIPAMAAGLARNLRPELARSAVNQAARRVDPDQPVQVRWIYYRARRRAS